MENVVVCKFLNLSASYYYYPAVKLFPGGQLVRPWPSVTPYRSRPIKTKSSAWSRLGRATGVNKLLLMWEYRQLSQRQAETQDETPGNTQCDRQEEAQVINRETQRGT